MQTFALFLVIALSTTLAEATPRQIAAASSGQRERAQQLRLQGDELFIAGSFEAALDHYRRGLALWEHPALHLSAGLCALELRDWLAAIASFEAALAFGDGLLPDDRAKARHYLKGARAKTAVLEVSSAQGAALFVDGKQVAAGELRVLPGAHVVTARSRAVEASEAVHLTAGEHRHVRPVLEVAHVGTRWSTWKPWAVFAGGVLVAAASIPLYRNMYELADRAEQAARGCFGCDGREYDALRTESTAYRRYGTIALGAGGVLAITGIVLVAANTTVSERRPLPMLAVAPSGVTLGVSAAW